MWIIVVQTLINCSFVHTISGTYMRVSNDMDLVGDKTNIVILSSDQFGCAMSCRSNVTCTAASFHKTSRTCKLTGKDTSKPGTKYSAIGFVLLEKGKERRKYFKIDYLCNRFKKIHQPFLLLFC